MVMDQGMAAREPCGHEHLCIHHLALHRDLLHKIQVFVTYCSVVVFVLLNVCEACMLHSVELVCRH